MNRPVFLVGYMCSGKTTLGRALARALGADFIDLDELVEANAGMTVSEIFATAGEAAFRRMEADALRTVSCRPAIIAVGGGTPCHAGNMDVMNGAGATVFLDAPVPRLVSRLLQGAATRPLVAGMDAERLTSYVGDALSQRMPYYRMAHHTFDSSRLEDADQIARSVQQFIKTIRP